jgi:hypothetical protein
MYKDETSRLLKLLLICSLTYSAWTSAAESKGIELSEKRGTDGQRFWAYQPPKKASPPQTRNRHWPRNDIDRFILAKLEAKDITPVADADKRTLARRAYYDLTGLAPSPEEMDEFANDLTADAFARLVDRLLASPHFGERWGRHWLDVARFGESVTLRGFVFKEAWRYRDYVIDAFNSDLPYDRFIREQVAGDLMPSSTPEDRRRQIIATTFLALGNTNLEEQDKAQLRMDVVDEQLDTIGKAFLGQTIGCARCHDHKFDPIPTRDYYAMAGILRSTKTLVHANVSTWIELPLPVSEEQEEFFKRYETAVATLEAALKSAKESVVKLATVPGNSPSAQTGPLPTRDLPGVVVDDAEAKRVGEWRQSQYSGRYIGDGYVHDLDAGKGEKTLTFHPELLKAGRYEVRLAYVPSSNRAAEVPVTILSADGETTVHVNQQLPPPIDGRFISLGKHRFEQNGQGFVLISNQGTKGHVIADAVQFIPLELPEAPPASVGKISPIHSGTAEKLAAAKMASDEVKRLEAALKKLVESGPKRPMAMSVKEEEEIGDAQIHIRGSVHTLGQKARRGFLQAATLDAPPVVPDKESGRRELGEWLSGPSNPLTARIMVNRVWHWLFGAGLVRTTDNFGAMGETPSHPELLDYLAIRFIEEGWSVKKLIRQLMLTHTYQLGSASAPEQGESVQNDRPLRNDVDPENRLLWRMNRRRLDAECIRDTILLVSGQLKFDRGGSAIQAGVSADYGYQYSDTRRSVYVPVLRNALPELFEVFDFADPSMVAGCRNFSTVAPQALYLLNHPFMAEQAQYAAKRLLAETGLNQRARIERSYRLTLGRLPTDGEIRVVTQHLDGIGDQKGDELIVAWSQFYQSLFASVDFRYVD